MKLSRILAVLRREYQEIIRNRMLLLAIFVPALLLTLMPLGIMTFIGAELDKNPGDAASDFGRILAQMPELAGWSIGEVAQFILLQQFLVFFLLMPLIIPMSIAAQSIVGEKQQRSLEPLLATPIRTGELLFAKTLAAVAPAVLATWFSFACFLIVGKFVISSSRVYNALLNPMWLLAMLVLAPLLSLLSVSLAVVLSSRVNDTRTVQQIGGFIVLPIVLLGVAQTAGLILLNTGTFALGSVAVAILDALVLRAGIRLFRRETILTQWK